jgi:hypothetical protein
MSTDLAGAVPQRFDYKKNVIRAGYGAHSGFFIGLGEKFEEQSSFQCRVCKGTASVKNEPCNACKGTGKKVSTKIPILYELDGQVNEEWVTYTLTAPGTLADGTPKSASTLWQRIRALSGGITDPAEQSRWYAALPKPPRIAIDVMLVDNEKGDALAFASVRLHGAQAAAPAPAAQRAPEPAADDMAWPDERR